MTTKNITVLEDNFFKIEQTLEEIIYLNDVLNFATELGESDLSYREDLIDQVQRNARITEKLLKEMSDKISKAETELLKKVALTENE